MVRGPCLTQSPRASLRLGGPVVTPVVRGLWTPQLLLQPSCCPTLLGFPVQVECGSLSVGRVLGRWTDPG